MPSLYADLNGAVMDRFLTDSCGMFPGAKVLTTHAVWFLGSLINFDESFTAEQIVGRHLTGVGKENFAESAT